MALVKQHVGGCIQYAYDFNGRVSSTSVQFGARGCAADRSVACECVGRAPIHEKAGSVHAAPVYDTQAGTGEQDASPMVGASGSVVRATKLRVRECRFGVREWSPPLSRMQLNNEERLRGVSGDRGRQIT